ncbi:PTS sugar transporter subunit IIA [Hyphomicrobium sp. CS1GBMeth3]|uniref:PTS sugar transporter subunit IIA n=1 Tax=Hyphomicrobium sp. CS1GBMeth3 TaxID=1892845 RepID=UPI00093032D4|nr:PTS sugar transporter subunit IIA [Hyphomicrobium sp. CS1GBMeth3]
MDLSDLLAPGGIYPAFEATSKKQALQELSAHASEATQIDQRLIYDTLVQRERLGSTGLGRGIAVPHVKLQGLSGIVCLFARLVKPIDFESQDDEPVDLIFLLLAPDHAGGDHLKALAKISRLVREPAALERLRSAPDLQSLKHALTLPAASHAA